MEVRATNRIKKELEMLQRTSAADGFSVSAVSADTWNVSFVCPAGNNCLSVIYSSVVDDVK